MKQKYVKMITLGLDPYTGKRIRARVYATSKTALAQAEKDAVREFAKHGISSNMTFSAYLKRWDEAYCAHIQPVTKTNYQTCYNKMARLNEIKMSKITHTDLQNIMNDVWDTPELAIRLGRVMRSIWRSAVIDGVVDKNIAEGLKRPKLAKSERRALTEEELKAVKEAELSESDRFFVDVLLQFGLRPGEARALTTHDFDRKNRTLTISKSLAHDHVRPFIKTTKTGAKRVLPVPDSFWAKIPKVKSIHYFTNDNGEILNATDATHQTKRILAAINRQLGGSDTIKATSMTLYTFRHNKATQLYYLPGVSLKKKADYMGHSEKMFIQTYSHLDDTKEEIEALRNAM